MTAGVLVVGAGPVGVTTALLLHRLGVPCVLVERRSGPQRAPAAHAVNARTFEICRQAGVDMDAIAAAAIPPADGGAAYWVTRLGGEVLGRLPYERQGDDVLAVTPTPLRNLSQHRLEPILLDALRAAGAGGPRWGQRWLSAEPDGDGVVSTIVEEETGRRYDVRSRWLVAADGAGSAVRKATGIAQDGPERLQSFVMIHVEANLRALVRDTPGVLYWVGDPDCSGVFVAHDIDREWVFMHPVRAEHEPAAGFDEARCEALVRRALARPDLPLRVRTVSPWVMTCQVAERYRDGAVFLAGDAAHRFPPTGGLGLNTGVQDAHNLAWKIAAVYAGRAAPALLDSYQTERRPVARWNAEQSLENAMRLLEVPRALGADPDPAAARRGFHAALGDPDRRAAVAAAIARQAEHFDMLGLQLGFRYHEGALVPDPDDDTPASTVREFVPSSRPGARVPHGWVTVRGARRSTLDLIALDRPTLMVGPRGDDWLEAARACGSPLRCVRVCDADVGGGEAWWSAVAAMHDDGALLVRPDQHVAFRSRAAAGDPLAVLRHAVGVALGFPSPRPVR